MSAPSRAGGAALLCAVASGPVTLDVIHHTDALTLLRALPTGSVDAVITDPPYGLGGRTFEVQREMRGAFARHGTYHAIREDWDCFAPTDWMDECTRIVRPGGSVIVFGGQESIYLFGSEGLRLKWRLVNDVTWVKRDPPPNFTGRMMTVSTERFLWFCPSGSKWTYNNAYARQENKGSNLRDVWDFRSQHGDRLHPAQKPLPLISRIVQLFTQRGELIVDPFAGSGTTAVAARNTGRHWICGDSSLEYVTIARARLRDTDPYQDKHLSTGAVQRSLFAVETTA